MSAKHYATNSETKQKQKQKPKPKLSVCLSLALFYLLIARIVIFYRWWTIHIVMYPERIAHLNMTVFLFADLIHNRQCVYMCCVCAFYFSPLPSSHFYSHFLVLAKQPRRLAAEFFEKRCFLPLIVPHFHIRYYNFSFSSQCWSLLFGRLADMKRSDRERTLPRVHKRKGKGTLKYPWDKHFINANLSIEFSIKFSSNVFHYWSITFTTIHLPLLQYG